MFKSNWVFAFGRKWINYDNALSDEIIQQETQRKKEEIIRQTGCTNNLPE